MEVPETPIGPEQPEPPAPGPEIPSPDPKGPETPPDEGDDEGRLETPPGPGGPEPGPPPPTDPEPPSPQPDPSPLPPEPGPQMGRRLLGAAAILAVALTATGGALAAKPKRGGFYSGETKDCEGDCPSIELQVSHTGKKVKATVDN